MAVIGNVIRDGHELGVAEGPLLVDPVSSGTLDSKSQDPGARAGRRRLARPTVNSA